LDTLFLPFSVLIFLLGDFSPLQASGKAAAGLALMLKGTEENIAPLKHLDLSWNHVRPEGIKVMCLAAVPHTTLTTMSLAWNGGGDRRAEEGGKLDAGVEGKNGDKKDGDKKEDAAKKKVPAPGGGEALCALIRDNKSITELDLTSCRLGSDSCGMLPAAILANGVVKRIRLDGNRLGADLGAQVREWFAFFHRISLGIWFFLYHAGARCAFGGGGGADVRGFGIQHMH
jgi:hypothetical protein